VKRDRREGLVESKQRIRIRSAPSMAALMRYHSARCEVATRSSSAADIRHHWSRGSLEDALVHRVHRRWPAAKSARNASGFESILTRDALDFLAALARRFTSAGPELLAVREDASARSMREIRTFSADALHPRGRLAHTVQFRGSARPQGRDHRAHRSQDDHHALNSARRCSWRIARIR